VHQQAMAQQAYCWCGNKAAFRCDYSRCTRCCSGCNIH
jgi:hypothetical protein